MKADSKLFEEMIAYKIIPGALRARRRELNMTLRQACDKIGIAVSFLCDLERGRRKCSLRVALKISEVYEK
jgi:transcriptional regulator with XRE-family HTH domain